MFLTGIIIFFIVGCEWDALHLYIANNLDWMTVCIEQSQANGHSLTWDGVASLVKEAHRTGDPNVTPMVLDLIHGLRDIKVCIRLIIMRCKFNIASIDQCR